MSHPDATMTSMDGAPSERDRPEPISPDELVNQLREVAAIKRRLRPEAEGLAFHSSEEYVLAHADFKAVGSPLPDGFEPMAQKECFNNAMSLALTQPGLTYCEGYGSGGFGEILHAWCVDDQGRVVDPTWSQPEKVTYVGFTVNRGVLHQWTEYTGHAGVLGNHPINYRLLLEHGSVEAAMDHVELDLCYSCFSTEGTCGCPDDEDEAAA